jgi:glycosyltransferase involved in cell wall biosynthesis
LEIAIVGAKEQPRPMPMRVLISAPLLSAVSGISTHVNLLLGSSLAQTYQLIHFQAGGEGGKETPLARAVRLVWSPLKLAWAITYHRPAIVHLNTAMNRKAFWRDAAYVLVAKLLRRRVVHQIHGGLLPDAFCGNRLTRSIVRWLLRLPDAVVVLAEVEVEAYRRFVPAARVELIPNAIETNGVIGDHRAGAATNGFLNLVYLGRLAENKGILDIVSAIKGLTEREIKTRLSIAGSGPDEVRLRQKVELLGLSDQVTFHGPLFGEEKNRLWQGADIFVFPTYHTEGLPYALLESMAAGSVPVISPVGAIPDVMQDGVHGVFVPPKDPKALTNALARLANDRQLLSRMAATGRRRILERYTIERLATDFRQLYASL